MNPWFSLYSQVIKAIEELGSDALLFRGHGDSSWTLMPGLGRLKGEDIEAINLNFLEQATYFDFITRAGDLLQQSNDSWSTLFSMQHHGLPTRLLDWSETFGVALYFALKEGEGDAAIWLLNPFQLNKAAINRELIIHPHELNGTYSEYYIDKTKTLEGNVVAISPFRHNPRVFHQRAGFTLHDNLETPLDELHPESLRKIPIPAEVRTDARVFLTLAGISEFSLFPDLDGLARELKEHYCGRLQIAKETVKASASKRTKSKQPSPSAPPDGWRRR